MKEREIKDLMQNTAVPEIVDAKCQEAYNIIYKEAQQKKKHRKITLKRGVVIGLCAAVISGAFAVPVVAAHFSQNGFSFISKKTYTKDPAERHDLTPYAKPVEKLNEKSIADITLQSVYCDGSNISVSLMLTPKNNELFKDTTAVNGSLDITLDGKQLEYEPERRIIGFSGGDDGNYYAMLHYENLRENLRVDDKSQLYIKINELQGVNGYKMIGVNLDDETAWDYEPEKTVSISDDYEFEYAVEADTSHNKVYEVNETYGDVTLKKIQVTPFMSTVYISGLDTDLQFTKMRDQNGDEFEGIYVEGDDKYGFTAPYKTSEKLILDVCRLDMDGFPAEYSFDVPIDEGFADKYTFDFNDSNFDNSKVVYDPPMDEINNAWNEKQQALFDKVKAEVTPEPFGQTIQIYDGPYSYNYTLKGIEKAEISDYDIDEDTLDWYADENHLDECKLMLVTFDIENPRNVEMDFSMYQATPTLIYKNTDYTDEKWAKASYLHVFEYVSEKDNYGKYSNGYTIGAHETRTFTIGYIVPEECIDNGYWLYYKVGGSGGDIDLQYILNGEAKICETK